MISIGEQSIFERVERVTDGFLDRFLDRCIGPHTSL